jgi:hypothetical protein
MLLNHILDAILNGDVKTLASAALGTIMHGAKNAIDDVIKDHDPIHEIEQTLKDFARNVYESVMPDPEDLDQVIDHVKDLYEDVKTEGETVFNDIANDVNSALGTGEIPAEADGGLGQTHDNFTPQGDVPTDMGPLPGIDIGGTGMDRSDGGDMGSVGGGGGGYGGGSTGSSPTPLGGTGSSGSTPAGSGSGTQPPTAADLGLDPNSGAYIEYQPNQGQVQITYPDGTTETRPWPQR